MKIVNPTALFILAAAATSPAGDDIPANDPPPTYVLAIHGGSGTVIVDNEPDLLGAYREILAEALLAGYSQIQDGNSSLDAVEAAIVVMEDSPLFNAGKGAVFTHEGKNELDASIMTGDGLDAGAVAGISVVKNPIRAARAVMTDTPHVLLSGPGADIFAKNRGLETVEPDYFRTERRWNALQRAIERESERSERPSSGNDPLPALGTVGAVALDKNGNLAAGTSTGGMNNKRHGRIGDSPIIGAGTYADNRTVAVSSTGWGEKFIRAAVAHNVSAQMAYRDLPVEEAANKALEKVSEIGGYGGLVAIDRHGNIAMPFTTRGMYRGAITKEGKIEIYIYPGDPPWRPE